MSGPVTIEEGKVLFHLANGTLVSMPSKEIDLDATRALASTAPLRRPMPAAERKRLRVSVDEKQRLLANLQKSRAGASVSRKSLPAPLPASLDTTDMDVEVEARGDERYWKSTSRELRENVKRATEEVQWLEAREQRLGDELLALRAYGYDSRHFSDRVFELQDTRDAIEGAKLDIARAKRELAQFQDDARKQGILPGWLR